MKTIKQMFCEHDYKTTGYEIRLSNWHPCYATTVRDNLIENKKCWKCYHEKSENLGDITIESVVSRLIEEAK